MARTRLLTWCALHSPVDRLFCFVYLSASLLCLDLRRCARIAYSAVLRLFAWLDLLSYVHTISSTISFWCLTLSCLSGLRTFLLFCFAYYVLVLLACSLCFASLGLGRLRLAQWLSVLASLTLSYNIKIPYGFIFDIPLKLKRRKRNQNSIESSNPPYFREVDHDKLKITPRGEYWHFLLPPNFMKFRNPQDFRLGGWYNENVMRLRLNFHIYKYELNLKELWRSSHPEWWTKLVHRALLLVYFIVGSLVCQLHGWLVFCWLISLLVGWLIGRSIGSLDRWSVDEFALC